MTTRKAMMAVRLMMVCLTICQSGLAIAQSEDASPVNTERGDLRASVVKPRTWLTITNSLLHPVPRKNMFIMDITLAGKMADASATARGYGIDARNSTNGSNYGPELEVTYGLTESLYVSAKGSFTPGKSESTNGVNSGGFAMTNQRESITDEGMREPELAVGMSRRLTKSTRLTGELGATIPLGIRKTEGSGNDFTTNGMNGGSTITPRLIGVHRLPKVKLIGTLAYAYELDRKSEKINRSPNFSANQSSFVGETESGGNTVSVTTGAEVPSLYNLGAALIYARTESSSTKRTTNSLSNISRTETVTTEAQQNLGVQTYAGISLDEFGAIIRPSVAYMTALDRQRGSISIEKFDVWIMGISGIMQF